MSVLKWLGNKVYEEKQKGSNLSNFRKTELRKVACQSNFLLLQKVKSFCHGRKRGLCCDITELTLV